MKRVVRGGALFAWLLAVLLPSVEAAEKKEPTIDDLRVPVSPAFVLLGVAPTAVERPSTPRALGLSILSATERSGSNIPADLALEFTPYWWKSHPDLTFEKYYGIGVDGEGNPRKKSVGSTILETLAFSLATTDLEDQTGVPGTSAGLGVRFMLLHGKPALELPDKVEALKAIQVEFLLECVPDDPDEPVNEECVARFEGKLREAGRAVAKLDKERRGVLLEFAGAWTEDFPDDDTNQRNDGKAGAWLTVSYHGTPRSLTFLGVGRYFRQQVMTERLNRYDVGARLIWKSDREAMPPLALSLEYLRRFTGGEDDTDRLVAVLEYLTPLDNISIIASYGKTFDEDFTGRQDLVSTLGVNFGFGRGPIVKMPPLSTN